MQEAQLITNISGLSITQLDCVLTKRSSLKSVEHIKVT